MVEEEFRKIPSEHYFDLTARFNATDNMTFTFTVQNLFDNQPKVVGNTIGSTTFNSGNVFPSTYDALGRRYAVSRQAEVLKFPEQSTLDPQGGQQWPPLFLPGVIRPPRAWIFRRWSARAAAHRRCPTDRRET